MSLVRTWCLYSGLFALSLLPIGCESGGSETPPGTGGSGGTAAEPTDECELGTFAQCQPAPGCHFGTRPCLKGPPNAFATECICESIELSDVRPSGATVNRPNGLAFGDDAFYWTEYVFVQFESFSRLFVSSPFGAQGRLLASLEATEPVLEVDGDRIHVRDSAKHWVYSTEGELLETEDLEVPLPNESSGAGGASGGAGAGGAAGAEAETPGGADSGGAGEGADPARIVWTQAGLTLDGELITERVSTFSVTESGVYYVLDADRVDINFISFDAPDDPDLVASTYFEGTFSMVGVQGDHLYAAIKNDYVAMWRIVYGDLSGLGR